MILVGSTNAWTPLVRQNCMPAYKKGYLFCGKIVGKIIWGTLMWDKHSKPLNGLEAMPDKALRCVVPGAGIEPARLAAGDFESPASTNFTTRANSILTCRLRRKKSDANRQVSDYAENRFRGQALGRLRQATAFTGPLTGSNT